MHNIQELVELKKQGYTYRELSEMYNVSVGKIFKLISPIIGKKHPKERKVSFDVEKAKKLYNKNKGWREIGKELGVHPYSVQSKFESMGLISNNPKNNIPNEDIKKVLWLRSRQYTYKAISKIVGISQTSVCRIVKRNEIE